MSHMTDLWLSGAIFFTLQILQNSFSAGAPPRTPLGELTTLPQTQGCGLGLDVSVSRRSRDVPTSRLGLVSIKVPNVSVSSRSLGPVRLGSRLVLDPKRLWSRGGCRTISSRRDVSCRRAQLNYSNENQKAYALFRRSRLRYRMLGWISINQSIFICIR